MPLGTHILTVRVTDYNPAFSTFLHALQHELHKVTPPFPLPL